MNVIPWWYTKLGEEEKTELLSAFEGKYFSQGGITAAFEKQLASLLDVPYAIVTPSGTAAITMSLMASGVGPGDEVIIPALTWIATGNAAAILGARVVLVDCLPDVPLMDPFEVKGKITPRTKAIIPVHLNGRSTSMSEWEAITNEKKIMVVEDACKALTSRSTRGYLGTSADFGCYSLGMISILSIGYGGAIVTNDKELYEKLLIIRNQGVEYSISPTHLDSEEAYAMMGFNFKVSDILAAVGLAQVSRLSEKQAHLLRIYRRYEKGLSDLSYIDLIPNKIEFGEIPILVQVMSDYRHEIMNYLDQQGIGTLKEHIPLNRARYLKNTGKFPNSDIFANKGFVLPCGPSQPLENVDRTIEVLQDFQP